MVSKKLKTILLLVITEVIVQYLQTLYLSL